MTKLTVKKSRQAFTLIELLVVIAIIGTLTSLTLIFFTGARAKTRDTKRLSDLKQIQTALELYFDSYSVYPTDLTKLAPPNNTFMPYIPVPPLGAADISYKYAALTTASGVCNSYHMGVTLEGVTNITLNSDADLSGGTVCTGFAGTDFSGTDPVYDIRQ